MYKDEQTKQVSTNVENGGKNKKGSKKIVIAAILVAVVLGGIGVGVYVTQNKKQDEVVDENELLVTEKDTYEGLNYTQTKVDIEKKSFFYDLDRNLEGSKIDVSYISVGELKDSTLEAKINEVLKDKAQSMYDTTSLENSQVLYDHVYNYTDVYIFNNVLSTMYCRELCDIEGNISYEYSSVNINLRDFVEFSFSDIFVNTANLDEILSQDIKQKVDDNTLVFSLSPKNIYVVNGDNIEKISLYSNKDTVAIYKRFANDKKICKSTYSAKPYVFTTKRFYETDSYGLVETNLFIDTYNEYAKGDSSYSDEVLEALDDLYKEGVNKAKNLSYSNPSKRYIVQIVPKVEETEDGYYNLNVVYTSFEINKDFFNGNIEKFVVASENKTDAENELVQFFNDPVMDAQKQLLKTSSEVLEKVVDSSGKEKIDTTTTQTIQESAEPQGQS